MSFPLSPRMNRVQAKLAGIGLLLAAVALIGRPALQEAVTPSSRVDFSATGLASARSLSAAPGEPGRGDLRTADSRKQRTAVLESEAPSTGSLQLLPSSETGFEYQGNSLDSQATRSSGPSAHAFPSNAGSPAEAASRGPISFGSTTTYLRQEIERQLEDLSIGQAPVAFPAVLIELDVPQVSSLEAAGRLGEVAGEFADALDRSGLDPASPDYRRLWNREKSIADARFRAMYGGHAWMAHHIEAHHKLSGQPGQ
jgi:hypothetical protein